MSYNSMKSNFLSIFEDEICPQAEESTFLNSSTVPTYEEFTKKTTIQPFHKRFLNSTQGLSRLSIVTDDESEDETFVLKSPKNYNMEQLKQKEVPKTPTTTPVIRNDFMPTNLIKNKTVLTPILKSVSRTPKIFHSPARTPKTIKKVNDSDSGDEYGFYTNKFAQTSFTSDLEVDFKNDQENNTEIVEDSILVIEPPKKTQTSGDFNSYKDNSNTNGFKLQLSSSTGTTNSESDSSSKKDSLSPVRQPKLSFFDANVTQRKKNPKRVSIKPNNNVKKRVSICGQALNDDVFNIDDTIIDQFDNELDHKKGLLCSIIESNDNESQFPSASQRTSVFSSTKLVIEQNLNDEQRIEETVVQNKNNKKEASSSENDEAFEKFLSKYKPKVKPKETSSSEDDAFEKFLNQHRPKSNINKETTKDDLKEFIIDESIEEDEYPNETNEETKKKKKTNRKLIESRIKNFSTINSSSSENVDKSDSDDQEYDEQYDRDLQLFYIRTTNLIDKNKPKKNTEEDIVKKEPSYIELDESSSSSSSESESSFMNSSSDSDKDDSFSRIFKNKTNLKSFNDQSTFKTPKRQPKNLDTDLRLVKTAFVPKFKEPIKKLSFIESLSKDIEDESLRDPSVEYYIKKFHVKTVKQDLLNECYRLINRCAFDNQLPNDMKLVWSDKITSTAGYCKYSSRDLICEIHISTKVCTDAERLRDTLAHEMCHAAAFLISRCNDNHGPIWKSWTRKVNFAFKKIPKITVTHSYSVTKKFIFKCTKCHLEIHRFSKSINIEKEVCGICHGRFEIIKNSIKNASEINKLRQERMEERFDEIRSELHGISGTPTKNQIDNNKFLTPRQPNKFALFVKENYSSIKKDKNLSSHKDVMQELSKNFKTLSTK